MDFSLKTLRNSSGSNFSNSSNSLDVFFSTFGYLPVIFYESTLNYPEGEYNLPSQSQLVRRFYYTFKCRPVKPGKVKNTNTRTRWNNRHVVSTNPPSLNKFAYIIIQTLHITRSSHPTQLDFDGTRLLQNLRTNILGKITQIDSRYRLDSVIPNRLLPRQVPKRRRKLHHVFLTTRPNNKLEARIHLALLETRTCFKEDCDIKERRPVPQGELTRDVVRRASEPTAWALLAAPSPSEGRGNDAVPRQLRHF